MGIRYHCSHCAQLYKKESFDLCGKCYDNKSGTERTSLHPHELRALLAPDVIRHPVKSCGIGSAYQSIASSRCFLMFDPSVREYQWGRSCAVHVRQQSDDYERALQ